MRVELFTSLILAFSLASCDKIGTFESLNQASETFEGFASVKVSESGAPVLYWDKAHATGAVTYEVLMQTNDGEDIASDDLLEEFSVGKRSAHLVKVQALGNRTSATLVATTSELSYTLTNTLQEHKSYTFFIQAKSDSTEAIYGGKGIYLSAEGESSSQHSYPGCVSAEALSANEVKIDYEFSDQVKSVLIYRNDQLVHVNSNPTETTWIDKDLSAKTLYQYRCSAEFEDNSVSIGNQAPIAQTLDPLAELRGSFEGCESVKAIGSTIVEVKVDLPDGADAILLHRDGTLVRQFDGEDDTTYIDSGLIEGQQYTYRCDASLAGEAEKGKNQKVRTLISNAPNFDGVQSVDIIDAQSVKIKWLSASGVIPEVYRVYAALNDGSTLWEHAPVAELSVTEKLETTIEGLGDELTYRFGVRACSDVENDICDANTVIIQKTMPDGGAPKTPGADALALEDSKLSVSVPWQSSHGAVLKRHIYLRKGDDAGGDVSQYTKVKTVAVSDINAPPQTIYVNNLEEYTSYYVIARDEDPSGHETDHTTPLAYTVADLTAPSFGGILGVSNATGGLEETALKVSFQAITSQPSDANGASEYLIYTKQGVADACASGTTVANLDATNYTAGTTYEHTLTGLQARTIYSICIKASDEDGNISANTNFLSRSTLDTTAPDFDGVQDISYNSSTQKIDIIWNPSSSADIKEYKIQVWNTGSNPDPSDIVSFIKDDANFDTGFSFDNSEFSFSDNDEVFVLVNACDTAGLIAGGSQNCTSYAYSAAKSELIPDATAPQGFLGVSSPSQLTTPAQGQVLVKWNAPNDWNDYRGFKVYEVDTSDNSITSLKTCPCSGVNCPNQITTCLIDGLDAYRTYYFHVRAYDDAGNETTYVDPSSSRSPKRTIDTENPTFASGLSLSFASATVSAAWQGASDNQYGPEAGSITYKLYRKYSTDFSDPSTPWADGQLAATTTNAYFDDEALSGGTDHYYVICAEDASSNITCDSAGAKSIYVPDLVPPTIDAGPETNKQVDSLTWNLTWEMSDNVQNDDDLKVSLYRKVSDSRETATTSDEALVLEESGSTYDGNSDGVFEITGLTGLSNQNKYLNYLLVVKDSDGNAASESLTVKADFAVTISNITRAEGTTLGGKLILIEGGGFYPGATAVTIGGEACTDIEVYIGAYQPLPGDPMNKTGSLLGCITPAHSAGSKNIQIAVNATGSSATKTNAYTYCDPASCASICDRPGDWDASFAQGSGISASPYLICDGTHLDNIRSNWNKIYQLGDNIDLSSFTANSFEPLPYKNGNGAYFNGYLNGDGYTIANWTFNDPTVTRAGLFADGGNPGSLPGTVANLGLANVDITAGDYTGALMGECWSARLNGDFWVQGTLSGGNYVGGLVGNRCTTSTNDEVDSIVAYVDITGGSYLGGIYGGNSSIDYKDIYVRSNVTASGGSAGGAFGGTVTGSIHDCKADSVVSATTDGAAGFAIGINGSLANCEVRGQVSGAGYVGGVVRTLSAGTTVTSIYGDVDVSGTSIVGGLFAEVQYWQNANVSFYNSVNLGNVEATDNSATHAGAGGIVGRIASNPSSADINNARVRMQQIGNIGNVNNSGQFTGGIWGEHRNVRAEYSEIFSTGNVSSSTDQYIGGLIGRLYTDRAENDNGYINASYSTGDVTGNNYAGGLIGQYTTTVNSPFSMTDVYYQGTFTGIQNAGGLLGSSNVATITNAYSQASFGNTVGSSVGGLLGAGTTTFSDSYWDQDTSSMSTSQNSGAGQAEAKTTDEMETLGTYSGWDFANDWFLDAGSTPELAWTKKPWAWAHTVSACSGSGGSKTVRVVVVNHRNNRELPLASPAITVNDGSSLANDTCSGATLYNFGDRCQFDLTYATTPTGSSNSDITIHVTGSDWADIDVDSASIDNSCP